MIFNILAVKDNIYVELAILNINSYHKLDGGKMKFILYLDNSTNKFFESIKSRLSYPDLVSVSIFSSDDYWQKNKINIFRDYYKKDDFIIVDADSYWHSIPNISKDKITFLNCCYEIGNIPKDDVDFEYLKHIDGRILPQMTNNQIGFLSIPKKLHYNGLLEEWIDMCDNIYGISGCRVGLNRMCEQLSISLLSQMNKFDIEALKGPIDNWKDKNIIQSFYWGSVNNNVKEQIKKEYF